MYWNNPTILVIYPRTTEEDPIKQSFHNGVHCMFYDPAVTRESIRYQQSLQDICDWANGHIERVGVDGFINNPSNHYDIANIVKLNMWIDDIRKQGIVKPMNIFYDGQEKYGINNGESRLRAVERIASLSTVTAFICTRQEHADRFSHLEQVRDFEHFASLCKPIDGQKFLFQLTDPEAPYGIFWYEYDSRSTALVTPPEKYCVETLHQYLKDNPGMKFTPDWFDELKPWPYWDGIVQ
jgi:hypothetical protein